MGQEFNETDGKMPAMRRRFQESQEMFQGLSELMKDGQGLMDMVEALKCELQTLRAENESLRQQLRERDMQLAEMNKLSNGIVSKTSDEPTLKDALKVYINRSKRKTIDKRVWIKSVMLDLVNDNGVVLPEDLRLTLDGLDDVVPEPASITIDHAVVHIGDGERDEARPAAGQDVEPKDNVELCLLIAPDVDTADEWRVHNEIARLVTRQGIQEICRHLARMRDEGKVLLPLSPEKAYRELVRMGMPEGEGYSIKTFSKYYAEVAR